jgi:hypothetical protein
MAVITTAVIAAGTAIYSGVQQRKAAKAGARAQRAQQRQAELAAARERRAAVRDSRVKRSSIEAQAVGQGLVGSTAPAGAMANVTTRTNENLSFMDQIGQLSSKASAANQAAASYNSRANLAQTVGQVAGAVGGQIGGGDSATLTLGQPAPTNPGVKTSSNIKR